MSASKCSPLPVTVAADTSMMAERGYCHGAVISAAAAAGVLTLYDGAIANNKKILQIQCAINGSQSIIFPNPVPFETLRSALTGAGVIALAYISK